MLQWQYRRKLKKKRFAESHFRWVLSYPQKTCPTNPEHDDEYLRNTYVYSAGFHCAHDRQPASYENSAENEEKNSSRHKFSEYLVK